jgi:predicted lysophospholipase L1 biosynthesis ABC-type transport system permease subunit
MLNYGTQTISDKEKIAILLKEYDTLRAEIIARTTGSFQMIAVTALLTAALMTSWSSRSPDALFWICLLGVVLTAFAFVAVAHRNINRLARRIMKIEDYVNRLAGSEILAWESKWGGAARGWVFGREPD